LSEGEVVIVVSDFEVKEAEEEVSVKWLTACIVG
jgi:hypothetical protein